MGIVLNYCQYGVLYLGSYYNTGPYISFPHFENSNLGKLPYIYIYGGFPKFGVPFFGVPIIRTIVYWVDIGVPPFWESTIRKCIYVYIYIY